MLLFAHLAMPPLFAYAFIQAGSGMHTDGWASLGVGGVLAGIVFYFYRQDRMESQKRIEAITQEYKTIAAQQQRVTMALLRMVGEVNDDTQS